MKRLLFTLSLMTAVGAGVNAQTVLVNDDFESYPAGQYYGGHWVNWTENPADLVQSLTVTTENAASGTKSGLIGPKADGQDVLLKLPRTFTSGVITSEWKMYIPDSNYAYYNIQETSTHGEGGSWGYECYTNFFTDPSLAGKMVWVVSDGAGNTSLYAYVDVTFNEWFTVKQVMDLNTSRISLFVNNVEAIYADPNVTNEWPGSQNSMNSFNFYGADDLVINPDTDSATTKMNTYFLDDFNITVVDEQTSVNDIALEKLKVNFYPNPATGILNITAEERMQQVEIYNMAGQKVMQTTPNSKTAAINVSSLASGLYSATIKADNKTLTKKFTVK